MSGVNTHPSPQEWEGFGSGFLQGWSSRADTWETAPRQSLLLFYSLNPVCRVCDQPSRRCQSPVLLNLTSPGTHKLCLKQQWPTDHCRKAAQVFQHNTQIAFSSTSLLPLLPLWLKWAIFCISPLHMLILWRIFAKVWAVKKARSALHSWQRRQTREKLQVILGGFKAQIFQWEHAMGRLLQEQLVPLVFQLVNSLWNSFRTFLELWSTKEFCGVRNLSAVFSVLTGA